MRGSKWRWVGRAVLAMVGVYALALLFVPQGECGRDSSLWFHADMTRTNILFGGFGPESGSETVAEAADFYALDLLGVGGYELVVDEADTPGPAFRVMSNGAVLLGGFEVSETEYGRYYVAGDWTCHKNFTTFMGSAGRT